MKKKLVFILGALALVAVAAGLGCAENDASLVRVGYFPNITHAQALVGMADGSFQKALGEKKEIKTFVFNAGPSVIEALFAGEIDIAYIGPNPAVNGYVRSGGTALKIIAGVTSGGAVLVVRSDAGIKTAADFAGKKIASPQLGNTQDIALRSYLLKNGLKFKEPKGTVQIIPMQNPDILTAFVKKEIDAAWVPEPWGTRLVVEGKGAIFLDERTLWPDGKFATTVLIVNTAFLKKNPELVKRWLRAHVDVTQWIHSYPEEAKTVVNQQIEKLTGKKLKPEILNQAWSRMESTYEPLPASVFQSAHSAFDMGFLGRSWLDLSGLYDLSFLNDVLAEKKLETVSAQGQK